MNTTIPEAITSFHKIVRPLKSSFRLKIKSLSYDSEIIMRMMRKSITAKEALVALSRCHGLSMYFGDNNEAEMLFSYACHTLFTESDPYFSKKGDIGNRAMSLTLTLTGLPDDMVSEGINILYSLPLINLYGHIEETYIKLKGHRLNLLDEKVNLPLEMRRMVIPLSDEIFSIRSKNLIPLSASILSKKVLSLLKFSQDPNVPRL